MGGLCSGGNLIGWNLGIFLCRLEKGSNIVLPPDHAPVRLTSAEIWRGSCSLHRNIIDWDLYLIHYVLPKSSNFVPSPLRRGITPDIIRN